MKYHGIVISDIHFGAFNSDILMKELYSIFIKYLESLSTLDFIVITGDYFDHKTFLNERFTKHAIQFMDKLVSIAKIHKCPIRIVYGTESHEVGQYSAFSIYSDDESLDFKVIHTVEEEELLPDMNVLYLPEEFIYSKKEYYKDYFEKKDHYDYIFGHGVIQEVMTQASKSTEKHSDTTRKKVPIFTTSELISICKGQVYFGHYHVNTNIMDKVFYVGSYSRWIHGEEEPKGFYHIQCKPSKEKYEQEFIENSLARKFVTYHYGYDSKVIESEESLLSELEKKDRIAEANEGDHVRYVFNIPEDHPNPEFVMRILNERYKFNDSIKVNVTNGYVEKKKSINRKSLNDAMDEYPMIFDKSVKIENKVMYFIKKKFDRDVDLEQIKKYLYEG